MKTKINATELKFWLQSLLEDCNGNSFDIVLDVKTRMRWIWNARTQRNNNYSKDRRITFFMP